MFGSLKKRHGPRVLVSLDEDEPPLDTSWIEYTYGELLSRVTNLIHTHHPLLAAERKKMRLDHPIVTQEGSRKTVIYNFATLARQLCRPPEHMAAYAREEFLTHGTFGGDHGDSLTLKGRFDEKRIERMINGYGKAYVMCLTCRSYDTKLLKQGRLHCLHCFLCGSERTVRVISSIDVERANVVETLTSVGIMGVPRRQTPTVLDPSEVALAAYYIWIDSGCVDGHALDHWLQAEHLVQQRQEHEYQTADDDIIAPAACPDV